MAGQAAMEVKIPSTMFVSPFAWKLDRPCWVLYGGDPDVLHVLRNGCLCPAKMDGGMPIGCHAPCSWPPCARGVHWAGDPGIENQV